MTKYSFYDIIAKLVLTDLVVSNAQQYNPQWRTKMKNSIKKNKYGNETSVMMKLVFAIILGQYYQSEKLYLRAKERLFLLPDEKPAYIFMNNIFGNPTISEIQIEDPIGLEDNGRLHPHDGEMERTINVKLFGAGRTIKIILTVVQPSIDGHVFEPRFEKGQILVKDPTGEVTIDIGHASLKDYLDRDFEDDPLFEPHWRSQIGELISCDPYSTFLFVTKDI